MLSIEIDHKETLQSSRPMFPQRKIAIAPLANFPYTPRCIYLVDCQRTHEDCFTLHFYRCFYYLSYFSLLHYPWAGHAGAS